MRAVERLSHADVGLTRGEYARICETLGREPNLLELGMFGVLWSEHCSYKHSRSVLRRLPTSGGHVLYGPGENAGAVDIGDGLAAVMKIESHNHPSAVEPVQGAATGVGGILRDIFAMGARPIALLDALCFGDPRHPRTAYLLNGVVSGISFYGNCAGVPTVGGSISFDPSFTHNPLVNVLCLGLAPRERILTARASGVGNPVLLVGSATGRDGIAGASFASVELRQDSEDRRPAVQVGNPFLEKLLLEACLELAEDQAVVAMQDLGAAGLAGAATEIVARGVCGIEIDVSRVSRREHGMTPYEVMLSESQERMVLVVQRGAEERVQRLFQRWELHSDVVGRITEDGRVRVVDGPVPLADVPVAFLAHGAAEYQPVQGQGMGTGDRRNALADPSSEPSGADPPFSVPSDLSAVLLDLLGSPGLCSRRPVFEQYDHMVQTNTLVGPGAGAAVLRVKGTSRGLALGLGGNSRACMDNPRNGGATVVAEACRNVACAGARPVALTDCLNFGDPERWAVWESLTEVVEGMREACIALDVPIISGNVSLYNETEGAPILPSPIVGALGVIEDVRRRAQAGFQLNQLVWLLGPLDGAVAGSEYACTIYGWGGGSAPAIDLDLERRLQQCVRELIQAGAVTAASDVAEGGLAVALAELALSSETGVDCQEPWTMEVERGARGRVDAVLFGEAPSRIILGSSPEESREVEAAAGRWNVPLTRLGRTGGSVMRIGNLVSVSLEDARGRWAGGLDRLAGA